MDHRFNVDNAINTILNNKEYWYKFDERGSIPKTYLQSISKMLKFLYVSKNLSSTSMIEKRVKTIHNYRKQLMKLMRIPNIEQRTSEWYKMREGLITASDFGDALGIEKFGKKANVKGFYEKKCGFKEVSYDENNVFLQWGVMFEPIATSLYETRSGIKVNEFGLIKNTKHEFLGASPDGITDMGVMLEIKCPYKRVITEDSILKQYYYQIQGQLDACELNECDFLEVNFDRYETDDQFWEDYESETETYTCDYKEKGIILKRFIFKENEAKYIYSPPNITKSELTKWYSTNNDFNKFETIFWNVKKFTLKRVYKDDIFVNNMNINLKTVWDNIVYYKTNPDKFKQIYYPSTATSTKTDASSKSSSPLAKKTTKKGIVGALFIRDDDN